MCSAWALTVRASAPTVGGLGLDAYGCRSTSRARVRYWGPRVSPSFGALGSLPGMDGGAAAGLGQAASLGTLSVPPSWADAVSNVTPLPALDANVMPGGYGATPLAGTGSVCQAAVGCHGRARIRRRGAANWVPPIADSAFADGRIAPEKSGPHTQGVCGPQWLCCGVRPSCRRRRSRCWPCCCRRTAPSGRGRWPARRSPGSYDPTG